MFSAVLAVQQARSCKSSHSALRTIGPSPLCSFLSCSSRPPSSSLQEVTSSQPGLNCSNLETELLTSTSVKGEHSQQCLYTGFHFKRPEAFVRGRSHAVASARPTPRSDDAALSKDCPLRPRRGMTGAKGSSWWAFLAPNYYYYMVNPTTITTHTG